MEETCQYEFTSMRAAYVDGKDSFQPLPMLPDVTFKCDYEEHAYTVTVYQNGIRVVEIESEQPLYWAKFTGPLYVLERLLMLFDGAFVPLHKVQFYHGSIDDEHLGDGALEDELDSKLKHQRLSYFSTFKNFTIATDWLIKYPDVFDDKLVSRWISLLNQLDIVHQMYLYTIADSGMPVDFRLAFMVELAESLVDIVNVEKELFPSLNPGSRGTSLKQCLNALINTYGKEIFEREIADDYDSFLTMLVNSRVRIMHIKRKQNEEKYFDGSESVRYLTKLSLLYRVVLLDLLGVNVDYSDRLKVITTEIDRVVDRNEGA